MTTGSIFWITGFFLKHILQLGSAGKTYSPCTDGGEEWALISPLFFYITMVEKKTPTDIAGRLTALIEPMIADAGLELVDLQFRREENGWVLRLIIDHEEGVTLDHCTDISRETGRLIEVEDCIEHAYRLEVSSPGLERPLLKEKDYVRFLGRKARIKTSEPLDNQWVFIGTIKQVHNHVVTLQTEAGAITIPLAGIANARLVFDF
jgi:ribosome maturation factor RimP